MSIISVSDSNFEQDVLKSSVPVFVDFWAPWCGPCKMLAPILEDLASAVEGRIKIVKINVDDNPETPTIYQIRSIPTLILFKDGKILGSILGAGAQTKSKLLAWLDEKLS